MKKILMLLLLAAPVFTWAQSTSIPVANSSDEDVIFVFVETPPQYPGGMDRMTKFIVKNLKYPKEAKEKGIQGKVIVSFVVEKNGKLGDIKVLKDIGYGCGDEVVRVIKKMPKWKPGKQRGKPVRTQFTLPVNFQFD